MTFTNRKWFCFALAFAILASSVFVSAPSAKAASDEVGGAGVGPATIYSYQPSAKYAVSTNYSLKANGVEIPVVKGFNDYDYASFSMGGGPVTYELTILNTDKVHEYSISPKKLGIQADSVVGRTITFTTQKDEYLIIMMNNRATRLVIAADPAETDIPNPTGEGIYNVTAAPYLVTTTGEKTGVAARTAALQQAINDASSYGTAQGNGKQGIVYVPRGTYYIGNVVLKSNTALYMQPGATFVATGKTADYTEHWFKDSMGRPATWWISTAFHSTNIKIYGRGTIDGNGQALHDDKSTNGKGMINNLIVPIATSNFKMDGIMVRESAGWAIVPTRSNDLAFTNLKMFNSLGMGENDGIDICESQNVVVRNSIGIALDDPYSTKAWREDTDIASGKVPWPGSPEPVQNVLFEDAISWTLCYGFKMGQGVMQDQQNITFKDGVVYKAAVGFAIHHKYGSGKVSGITFENMDVEDISGSNEDNSAWMTMFTVNGGNAGVGPITGVTVKNIIVRDIGEGFSKLKGMEGAKITNITFENVYMPGKSEPAKNLHEMNFLSKEHYSGVTIKPVQNPEPRTRTNLALRQPAIGSSNDGVEDTSRYVNDGNLATRFGSKRGIDPSWIYIDLGENKTIDQVKLYWESAYGKSYQIQVANDISSEAGWQTVYSTTTGKGGIETVSFNEVSARYVRMYGTVRATVYGYSLWELEVYGPEVFADSITLNQSAFTLVTGNTEQLSAALMPDQTTNKNITWITSNSNVATVSQTGLVTAIGLGTVNITAKTQNGDLSTSAVVTVTEPTDPIDPIDPTEPGDSLLPPVLYEAVAGNGETSLSWNAVDRADGYKIFVSTTPGVYSEEAATVTGSVYNYLAKGLSNGQTYYFVIKAYNGAGESSASNEISAVPIGESGPISPINPPQPVKPSNAEFAVLINGKEEQLGTAETSTINGQSVTQFKLDSVKLANKLASEQEHSVIAIQTRTQPDRFQAGLTAEILDNLQQKNAVIMLQTDATIYTLPARHINLKALIGQINPSAEPSAIEINIEISKPEAAIQKLLDEAAIIGKFSLVDTAFNFTVTANYGGTNVNIDSFDAYVERALILPDDVDQTQMTTAVVIDPDGSVRHVPTKIVHKNGNYIAVISSLTNSVYALVHYDTVFVDIKDHWSASAVNDLSGRLIVKGVDKNKYLPNQEVTRAEFAALLVRALGLKPVKAAQIFTDVNSSAWYAEAVQTAYAYGLIEGFEDGTFRPSISMTREQAMAITAKAMKVTGLKDKLVDADTDTLLQGFADRAMFAEWALSGIADCLQSGLINGKTDHQLAPKANLTRAEVAALLQRLLQKSELI
ncbi:S-layer homology domain-containing protein [Paenibacillus sp. MCAF9]|uniref:S-layer homology domain-containing protein n=1 Tax=Paenibacillus sp. MCAF9 TaxID=3233046 RepID=UPI003F98BC52